MKPIIIGVTKDGRVDMTLEEFRKHMEDAYNQGYNDKSLWSLTTTNYGTDNKWWINGINTTSTTATKEV